MTRRKVLVALASEHAAWTIPPICLDTIRSAFGDEWDVLGVQPPDAKDAERGSTGSSASNPHEGVEVYFGWGVPRRVVVEAAGTLRWAHTGAAGVGGSLNEDLCTSGVVLTNSKGIHAEPMSDWVIAAIGFCIRGFHLAVSAQRERSWSWEPFTSTGARLTEFASLRVGIVGLGGIGRAVARKCHALGVEVRAVRRRVGQPMPADVAWVGGPEQLADLAAESDILVLTVPHTSETTSLVDDTILRALPRGSYLLNVSRGGILDEEALLRHLKEGHIGGCVLDVFASEPLEESHPFWTEPNVLVTPHVSAVTNRFWEREIDLIVENIGRYKKGDRLKNVVNLEAGY